MRRLHSDRLDNLISRWKADKISAFQSMTTRLKAQKEKKIMQVRNKSRNELN